MRASEIGVIDGESQDGSSLHDLDTDPSEAVDDEPRPIVQRKVKTKVVKGRKSAAVPKPTDEDDIFMNDVAPEVRLSLFIAPAARLMCDATSPGPEEQGSQAGSQGRKGRWAREGRR